MTTVAMTVAALIAGMTVAGTDGSGAAQRAGHGPNKRPNIVLVMTDDQALSQMSGEFMPNVSTLLAEPGTRFDHAYLTTPLCCPSRASLLTGQYGHNNGVLRNVYSLLRDKNNVLPVWLNRAGYVTAHLGKFMNLYRRHRPHPPQAGARLGPMAHDAVENGDRLLQLRPLGERQASPSRAKAA